VPPPDADIHFDHIHSCGGRIRSAAQDQQGHNAGTAQQLASYGEPWGNDMVGPLMGLCYTAITGVAMASFTSNAAALDDHGARAQAIGTIFNQAEDDNISKVNGVKKGLG
jgi:hypothetical protein